MALTGRNITFPIYNADGTEFNGLELKKATVDSVVMSLGDKITGDVYYKDNTLAVTMQEYVEYDGVRYVLVNPPTIVREGMVSDNSGLNGMTKYSFEFYHPMYMLANFPFSDVAVSSDEKRYLSQNKSFSWIGNLKDYVDKLNKNLEGTQWICVIGNNVAQADVEKLSDVLAFDNNTIADALKTGYDTWEIPYIVDNIKDGEAFYTQGKRFKVQFGLPTTEILDKDKKPFVFKFGQGVGLKNNSRTPRNNKIVTRIAGYGSEDNIPYGYPQIRWYGNDSATTTRDGYPIYKGIVGGAYVKLIKHPFTRTHLMPSIYRETVFNKVSPYLPNGSANPNYNPNIEIRDYYDADDKYDNPIVADAPSYEIHEFEKIKPELGEKSIIAAAPYDENKRKDNYTTKDDFLETIMNRATSTDIEAERNQMLAIYETTKEDFPIPLHGSVGDYEWNCTVTIHKSENGGKYADIKYTSSNYNFEATVELVEPTKDVAWNDDMDDDGNYKQSYMKITLPVLDFDLYACAAITQEMKINMRGGACIGCTFPVEVDWDDYEASFYDADGDFAPDGEQRDYERYPDSRNGQITVIAKKEIETFGTLMPNIYQQPKSGDEFVIIGISLPDTYITNAEQRLDTDMRQYMLDNNVYYFDYPLKFDEYFLATNTDILAQMKNNVLVYFDYAGATHALYIKQMTVKYGDKPLPQYDITLTDDVEIVLNKIGQVTEEVSNLRILIGRSGTGATNDERYLRKDVDDTAAGFVRLLKGMQVGERFVSGLLGEGGVFRKEADGTTYLECDKLYVRMKAYFDTVEVRRFMHSGGNRIASAAGIKCSRVEYIDASGSVTDNLLQTVLFRCYFSATDNDKTITNDFVVGDLAYCHETNVDVADVDMHHYWRAVVGKSGSVNDNGEHYIDLSVTDCQSGSDIPIAQDDIIQLGNKTDTTRQGAIIEYVSGADSPSYQIFQGINDYNLENKNYVSLGYKSDTGRAYMNVYGDFYFGDNDQLNPKTFIRYNAETKDLDIRANVEFTSPSGYTTIEEFASTVIGDINSLQSQVDGTIETWFYNGEPSMASLPESEWYAADIKAGNNNERLKHLGDLYYDSATGYAYRYSNGGTEQNPVFVWTQIQDTDVIKALANAEKAQDTADHKRRVFVAQPSIVAPNTYVEYDVGDLWVNATGTFEYTDGGKTKTVTYDNDLLRCVKSKPTRNDKGEVQDGKFSISDWVKASKYTDDSYVTEWISNEYAEDREKIREQFDEKVQTWYLYADPSTMAKSSGGWYPDGGGSADEIAEINSWHVGDYWYCTADVTNDSGVVVYHSGTTYKYTKASDTPTFAWVVAPNVPSEIFDHIDGKSSIFVNDPLDTDTSKRHPTDYEVGDMWVLPMKYDSGGKLNPSTYKIGNVTYPAGEVLSATKDNTGYDASDWEKRVRYTDDTALYTFIGGVYAEFVENISEQVDGKAETWYQDADPSTAWTTAESKKSHVGDIWCDTSTGGGKKTYIYQSRTSGGTTTYYWAEQSVPDEVFDEIDGKMAIYVTWNAWVADGVSELQKRDLFIPETSTAQGGVTYKANRVYRCTDASTPTFQEIAYTDDTTVNEIINRYGQILNIGNPTAQSVGDALGKLRKVLNDGSTIIDGGLVLTDIIYMKDLSASPTVHAGISGLYKTTETGTGYKGYGTAAWYGGGVSNGIPIDHEASPTLSNYAKSLFRFDGSGYLAGSNITWDANGKLTIKDIYTIIDGTEKQYNLGTSLNAITTLSNIFHTSSYSSVVYVNPQNAFDHIDVVHQSGYTLKDTSVLNFAEMRSNFVTIEYFNRLFQALNGSVVVSPNDTTTTIDSIKAMVGFWTEQYISALGKGSSSGGGGVSLNEPLASINSAGLGTPSSSGVGLVWNGSRWTYGTTTGNYLPLTGGTLTGPLTINSNLFIDGGRAIFFNDSKGNECNTLILNDSDQLHIGSGTAGNGYDTYISGKEIKFRYGTAKTIGLTISATGSVTSVNGFSKTNYDNNYVLLAGGGVKALSDIDGGGDLSNYVTLNTAQTISGLKTISGGLVVYGRAYGQGDDEGIIIKKASNGYAGVILGDPNDKHATIYYDKSGDFRFGFGGGNIYHPQKSGFIALTSDIPTDNSQLSNSAGYITSSALEGYLPLTGGTLSDGLTVQGVVFAYNYVRSKNTASIVFDKPGSYYTGIGARSDYANTIYFCACDMSGNWATTFKQKWDFNGTIQSEGNEVIHTGNIGSQSVSYANNAGMIEGITIKNIVKAFDRKLGGNADTIYDTGLYSIADWENAPTRYGSLLLLHYRQPYGNTIPDFCCQIFMPTGDNPSYPNSLWFRTSEKDKYNEWYRVVAQNSYGNVGIGTKSPSYTLDVNGTLGVTGAATLSSTLDVNGYTTINSPLRVYNTNAPTSYSVDVYGQLRFRRSSSSSYNVSMGNHSQTDGDGDERPFINFTTTDGVSRSIITLDNHTNQHLVIGLGMRNFSNAAFAARTYIYGVNVHLMSCDSSQSSFVQALRTLSGGRVFIGTSAEYSAIADTYKTGYKLTVGGNLSVTGTTFMSGATTINSTLQVSGAVTVNSSVSSTGGFTSSQGSISVAYNVVAGGYVSAGGAKSGGAAGVVYATVGVLSSGYVTALSDIREKDVQGNLPLTCEEVALAPMIRFLWKDRRVNGLRAGSIAQYWQRVLPEAVITDADGLLSMDYGVIALLSAIATARKVEDHERRIAELEHENERLRKEIGDNNGTITDE